MSGLKKHVSEPTRGDNFLDLVFSRNVRAESEVRSGIFTSDHKEFVSRCHLQAGSGPPLVSRSTALNYM